MDYQFTIVVPVYNEEDNLERVEQELVAYSKIAKRSTSILFVNDGSKDNSQELIETICGKNTAFHFIQFEENFCFFIPYHQKTILFNLRKG